MFNQACSIHSSYPYSPPPSNPFLPPPRYNADCETAPSLYYLAEEAFGTLGGSSDGGLCPAASPLSDAECAGVTSNCWSPGQRDTDCPNSGLCCFDGCADRCVDGPGIKREII